MRFLQKYNLALVLFLALLLNGSLSLSLHSVMQLSANFLMPVGMMLIALFDDTNKNELWLALGAGIISDIYFYGIIGVYTICLPGICWLLQKMARYLPEVFLVRIIVTLVGAILLNGCSWLILNLMGLISVPFADLIKTMIPTIIWSLVFAIISYPLWANLTRKYPFMVKLDNY